jgi:hypothetical protein
MARLIKHPWLWATVASLLLALWLLPPNAPRVRTSVRNSRAAQRTALDEAVRAMAGQITALNDELILLRLTDSLRVVMEQSGPITLDMAENPGLPPESAEPNAVAFASRIRDGIRRNLSREISTLPRSQQMKVGVFTIPIGRGGYRGASVSGGRGSGNLFLFEGDGPACVVTRATTSLGVRSAIEVASGRWRWYDNYESLPTNILGPCRFYAAYGLPGADVSEWLASGGSGFAMAPANKEEAQRFDRGRPFGLRYANLSLLPEAEACLAGRMDDCTSFVMSKRTRSGLTGDATRTKTSYPERIYSWDGNLRSPQRPGGKHLTLVADLEAEFGADRFQSFWSSNQPMETAFASAFGLPLDEWTHDWLNARFMPDKLGPGISWETLLYSLALISFCVSIVFAAARRRQVG